MSRTTTCPRNCPENGQVSEMAGVSCGAYSITAHGSECRIWSSILTRNDPKCDLGNVAVAMRACEAVPDR